MQFEFVGDLDYSADPGILSKFFYCCRTEEILRILHPIPINNMTTMLRVLVRQAFAEVDDQ